MFFKYIYFLCKQGSEFSIIKRGDDVIPCFKSSKNIEAALLVTAIPIIRLGGKYLALHNDWEAN